MLQQFPLLTLFFLVFQYLNIKLTDISVTDPEKYPHMVGSVSLFACDSEEEELFVLVSL